jgi:hypothetical protein
MEATRSIYDRGKSNITCLPKWPIRALGRVPDLPDAHRLARDVREAVQGHDPCGPVADLREICRAGRFRVFERELSGRQAGIEAALLPQARNRFHIWVDPTPPGGWDKIDPGLRPVVRRHRLRFRVAHEIAHSFFYRRDGGEPSRLALDSPEQEEFADAFASALLLPPSVAKATAPLAESVVRLHERYDVSLQVAVRAVAETHVGLSAALLHWSGSYASPKDVAELQWSTLDLRLCWRDTALPASVRSTRQPRGHSVTLRSRRQLLWLSTPLRRGAVPAL